MIKETSTCSYLMIVDTPRLCRDVAFMPPQENLAHPITCQPVISESQVDSWTIAKLDAARRVENLIAEHIDNANNNPIRDITEGVEGSSPRGPIIGGIEVGAQQLVGTEGKVIEKSVVVGGGKEVYVATVASSDGHQMSKEEMKKMNVIDPKTVEKFKLNLKEEAGKKRWKMNLVDTPRGRELRGIIEAEDEVDSSKRDVKKDGKAERKDDENDEAVQDGSEEVYKDEL